MIICPNCRHEEIEGALFCSECGSQITEKNNQSTQSFSRVVLDKASGQEIQGAAKNPSTTTEQQNVQVIMCNLLDFGKILPLSGKPEYTLGRIADGQPILPDVDFTQYNAFTLGVSRLHAALRLINSRLVVVDLGSANGTRVNGQKLSPRVEFPLNQGDVIALGKLRIQVTFGR